MRTFFSGAERNCGGGHFSAELKGVKKRHFSAELRGFGCIFSAELKEIEGVGGGGGHWRKSREVRFKKHCLAE